ncbi:hypothetical protein ATX25_09790 [Oenococcus oeni]|nr:hypothetical protein ATX25_09790 [Oenococcus oeni]
MTIKPTSQVLSNPTKDLQSQFINGSVTILDDPMLIDGLNNSMLVEDRGGAVKVDRLNRTSEHIDTTDAIINAHYSCQYYFENFKDENYNPINVMDSEGKRDYFKGMFG